MTRGRERAHEGLALESARRPSDRGPRRYPKLRLRTRLRGTHLLSLRHALRRRSQVPDPRTNRPAKTCPLPSPTTRRRADLSVPSRTRWRPCESARPSKSPGRSTNHPENRCTIGAHDTVEFESPLFRRLQNPGPPHRIGRFGRLFSQKPLLYRMSIVHCSNRRAPSEQFRTCPFC